MFSRASSCIHTPWQILEASCFPAGLRTLACYTLLLHIAYSEETFGVVWFPLASHVLHFPPPAMTTLQEGTVGGEGFPDFKRGEQHEESCLFVMQVLNLLPSDDGFQIGAVGGCKKRKLNKLNKKLLQMQNIYSEKRHSFWCVRGSSSQNHSWRTGGNISPFSSLNNISEPKFDIWWCLSNSACI